MSFAVLSSQRQRSRGRPPRSEVDNAKALKVADEEVGRFWLCSFMIYPNSKEEQFPHQNE